MIYSQSVNRWDAIAPDAKMDGAVYTRLKEGWGYNGRNVKERDGFYDWDKEWYEKEKKEGNEDEEGC